jgi:hypothetical protein
MSRVGDTDTDRMTFGPGIGSRRGHIMMAMAPIRDDDVEIPACAAGTWRALATAGCEPTERFDPDSLAGLPSPAQRFLTRALPAGAVLHEVVQIRMVGEIKLAGRWHRFSSRQVLRGGVGFVWAAVVGGRLVRFVGADVFGPLVARMEFRLYGRIPIVRAAGSDVERSASGRLAAETVAWLPQATTPQAGARWTPVDDRRAAVTLPAGGRDVRVEVTVDEAGRLRELVLMRWNDSADPPVESPFGGEVHSLAPADDGVLVAAAGTVGWERGTPEQTDGEFFRYRITDVAFGSRARVGRPTRSV